MIVDEEYAAHIDAVINALLAAGVEPMLCLEHYELPAYLLETRMMAGVLGMLSNCIASMQQSPLNVMVIGSSTGSLSMNLS